VLIPSTPQHHVKTITTTWVTAFLNGTQYAVWGFWSRRERYAIELVAKAQ